MSQNPRLTTASGIPVVDNQNSLSAGARGRLLLQDFQLIDHAKGSGAYGTFTVTHDITKYTKARFPDYGAAVASKLAALAARCGPAATGAVTRGSRGCATFAA